jgi:4-hydroxybenzoate polyprenyltransferase
MSESPIEVKRPLCVDLDGTLIKTDTFAQELFLLIRSCPEALFPMMLKSGGSLAAFKAMVAEKIPLDYSVLPYHEKFLKFLRSEKDKGRELILVTASDRRAASAVATHTGLFSDVLASDGNVNLKAEKKREALVERFGERGFDYAGNSKDDIPVWSSAAGVLAVNPERSARGFLKTRPVRFFDDRPAVLRLWLKGLRVRQWLKNVLIFLPMLLAQELSTPLFYGQALIAFFSFSFLASSIYVLNDLLDLHADQHHPRKCRRPFASGELHLREAIIAVPLLAAAAFALALFLPALFLRILLFYLLVTTLYSCRIKQWFFLDVVTLAGLYTIRILAGTAAYGVATSGWLLAFSTALFFSLALVKRYAELREAKDVPPEKIGRRGRGYRARHLPWLVGCGVVSGAVSTAVLGFYITSSKVTQFYQTPEWLWLLCPLVLYWIGRMWRLAVLGEMSDDPLEFAVRDRQTWVMGVIGALILLAGSLL